MNERGDEGVSCMKTKDRNEVISEEQMNVETVAEESTIDESVEETVVEETVTEDTPEETIEESTEEDIVEEESIVEEPNEEKSEEENVDDESAEEVTEDTAEETTGEDTAEETVETETTEETSTEESNSEELLEENAEAKSNKKIGWIIAGSIALFLVIVYLGTAFFFSNKFLMRTSVNGMNCTGKNIDEVETMIQNHVEDYVLTIETVQLGTEKISGKDINIQYKGFHQIEEAFDKQNAFLWPKAIFVANPIKAEIVFEYDDIKLQSAISSLKCVQKDNQKAPVTATVVFQDDEFVIQKETYGTQLHMDKVKDLIYESVDTLNPTINLDKEGCYVQPKFTEKSSQVIEAKDAMNQYLKSKITYSLDGIETVADKTVFASWISVDENMKPVVSTDAAKKYIGTLSSAYNTPNRQGVLTTPTGKQVTISNALLGRQVSVDGECKQLIADIQGGKEVKRSPIIGQQGMAEGQYVWGTTYVEVDISAQHMWYIKNGSVVFETDVVTGLRGKNDTPTGIYKLLEKQRNTTLVGRVVNGKPLYRTPVSYWMRVTWSGIGFHDANWQPTFGGSRYLTNGSHGCINMPPAKAGEFYNIISVGTPVVIHY